MGRFEQIPMTIAGGAGESSSSQVLLLTFFPFIFEHGNSRTPEHCPSLVACRNGCREQIERRSCDAVYSSTTSQTRKKAREERIQERPDGGAALEKLSIFCSSRKGEG